MVSQAAREPGKCPRDSQASEAGLRVRPHQVAHGAVVGHLSPRGTGAPSQLPLCSARNGPRRVNLDKCDF